MWNAQGVHTWHCYYCSAVLAEGEACSCERVHTCDLPGDGAVDEYCIEPQGERFAVFVCGEGDEPQSVHDTEAEAIAWCWEREHEYVRVHEPAPNREAVDRALSKMRIVHGALARACATQYAAKREVDSDHAVALDCSKSAIADLEMALRGSG